MNTISPNTAPQLDEKSSLLRFGVVPIAFVLLMWGVKVVEMFFDLDFYTWGIFPLSAKGIAGIFLSPFIHSDLNHLINNTLPILVLGFTLFYFYREVAWGVLALSILITGFWVWVFAREAYHIGASGVVYSLVTFLFVSGVIRKHPRLMAISLLVVFLYGSMVWGILPIRERISWESHLMGSISGILLAINFSKFGPQRKMYEWELEPGDEEEFELELDSENENEDEPGNRQGLGEEEAKAWKNTKSKI